MFRSGSSFWILTGPWILGGAKTLAPLLLLLSFALAASAQEQQKGFLSQSESAKIRDAGMINDRVHLFIQFAGDRMKQLQSDLEHPASGVHPEERINNLIIDYSSCVDGASDLIDEGLEKQEDIRKAIKEVESQVPDLLQYLRALQDQGARMDLYKDTLEDAVRSTADAIDTAQDAEKYQAEKKIVNKAKLLAKLGSPVFDRARIEMLHGNDPTQALATLQYYRDKVRKTSAGLAAAGVNVAKQPDGFKELQEALRVSLKHLDDLIFSLPDESRGPFEAVRSDLSGTETSLFTALFPSAVEKDDKNK